MDMFTKMMRVWTRVLRAFGIGLNSKGLKTTDIVFTMLATQISHI